MLKLFEGLYPFHLNTLEAIGKIAHNKNVQSSEASQRVKSSDSGTFDELDEEANTQGSICRASGVAVGYLGFAVVFCAVAPTAFQIESEYLLKLVGITKVFLMLLILYLIWKVGKKNGAKARWIKARRAAEALRYVRIHGAIQNFKEKRTPATRQKLTAELIQVLDGQIEYNKAKAEKYEAIEVAASRLSWAGFLSAFACACILLLSEFHVVPHQSILILGTAFLPALVGSIHGINGFLNISGLAESHSEMAKSLTEIRSNIMDGTASEEIVIDEAMRAYRKLSDRDEKWAAKSEKSSPLPG
jgi:hypothetical protein